MVVNGSISQTDSTYAIPTDKIIRLLADVDVCEEYSEELEIRLIDARIIIDRSLIERNEYEALYNRIDLALSNMTSRKMKLERKLKRTRTIGIIGTVGVFILGILAVLFI